MKKYIIFLELIRVTSLTFLLFVDWDYNNQTLIEYIVFIGLQILYYILQFLKPGYMAQIINCSSQILLIDCLMQQRFTIMEVLGSISIEITLLKEEQDIYTNRNLKLIFLPLFIGFRLMILCVKDKNFLILISILIFFIHFLKNILDYRIQELKNKAVNKNNDKTIEHNIINDEKLVVSNVKKQVQEIRISMSQQKEPDSSSRINDEYIQSNTPQRDVLQVQVPIFKQQTEGYNLLSSDRKIASDQSSKLIKKPEKFYKEFQILDLLPFGCIILNKSCQIIYQNSKLNKIFCSIKEQEILQHVSQMIQGSSISKKQKSSINHFDSQLEEEQFEKIKNSRANFNLIDSLISISHKGINQQQSGSNFDSSDVNTKFQAMLDLSFGDIETSSTKKYYRIKVYNNFSGQEILDSQQLFLIIIKDTTKKVQLKNFRTEHIFQNQLLQSFSHELRTPLNCSIQSIQAAIPVQQDVGISHLLKTALGSNFLLLHQINDILDSAAMENSNFQYQWTQFTFKDIINEILDMYSESFQIKGLQFIQDICMQNLLQSLKNDKSRILQILVNLINNAIKFTHQNGKIWLSIKPIENQSGRTFKLMISDNGVGIDEPRLLKIKQALEDFSCQSPVFKDSNKFLGLGLLNCCKIASGLSKMVQKNFEISATHEGTSTSFYIDDIPNFSSYSRSQSFFINKSISMTSNTDVDLNNIRIPIINFCFDRFKSQKNFLSDNLNKKLSIQEAKNCNCTHILIVDDVPFNHIALKAMLKNQQLTSDSAYDGDQAITKVVEKMTSHCKEYRLILMDIQMPKMDGFQATKEIKSILIENMLNSRIFMCSAYDTQENIEEAYNSYMDGVLLKPIRLENLKYVLRSVGLI